MRYDTDVATGEVAVTVLLAEYNALRSEIDRRSQAQQTLANLALTLSGALVGYSIANDALFVLLLQPVVASTLGALYADHGGQIARIGRYMLEHTAARTEALAGVSDLMAWEKVGTRRARRWRPFWVLPPFVTFVGTSVAVLVLTTRHAFLHPPRRTVGLIAPWPGAFRYLWLFGVFTTALCAIGFLLAFWWVGSGVED